MRYLLVGLMMGLLVWGAAYAADEQAAAEGQATLKAQPAAETQAPVEGQPVAAGRTDVTGIPLYEGPGYRSLDSHQDDITKGMDFHSFQHRPVDEVGYSPLTLEDFRYPVPGRTHKEWAQMSWYYPEHSRTVWHDADHGFTVTAFFFTRDMVRDHIQRMIDEYYVCDPDIVQQMIDYYAEVTPQCGEAISWVWFRVDDSHTYVDQRPNQFFKNYLSSFKDKFYLEFGLPKAQADVDEEVRDFLYQYRTRDCQQCGPEFAPCQTCDAKMGKTCDKCQKSEAPAKCEKCPEFKCDTCPEPKNKPHDEQMLCTDFGYKGFTLDPNNHYVYYPRKVVIEDITYDQVAEAYRWKFAWRFDDCEANWLKDMCKLGVKVDMALVLTDPTWYAHAQLGVPLKRDILAAADPNTWGNVWSASNLPYSTECCDCLMPDCPGNCTPQAEVGWDYQAPLPEAEPAPVAEAEEPAPAENYDYFPPENEKAEEPIKVKGNG
jgi:hypothetical protein